MIEPKAASSSLYRARAMEQLEQAAAAEADGRPLDAIERRQGAARSFRLSAIMEEKGSTNAQ